MTMDEGNASIELNVGVDNALRNIERLKQDAEALDDTLGHLGQKYTTLFNASLEGKKQPAASSQQVDARLTHYDPDAIEAISPELGQTRAAITERKEAIGQQVTAFAKDTPAAGDMTGGAFFQAFAAWQARQPVALPNGAPPTSAGVANGAGTSSTASAALTPLPFPSATPQDADKFGDRLGERLASALTHGGTNILASGVRGGFDAAGLSTVGDLAGGAVRPLMAALGGFAAPLAGIAGIAGAALGINNATTGYFQEQQGLGATVGGAGNGNAALTTAQNVGWQYQYHEADSVRAAQQLGLAGVQSSDMGGALSNSMALARIGNMSLGQTTGLTGDLARGGNSNAQTADLYGRLDQASRDSGVSLQRLVGSLQELQRAAGIGGVSVTGLAAAQRMAGSSLDLGQAMSGTVGAQGGQALQQMAILGMNPQQFNEAQANPAKLWDAYAKVAKQYDRGPYGTQVAEQALQAAGLDTSSLSGPKAKKLTDLLVHETPGAAEAYAKSLQAKETTTTPAALSTKGEDVANRLTTALDKASIAAERFSATVLRATDTTGRGRDTTPGRGAIQPTRVLPGDQTRSIPSPPPVIDRRRIVHSTGGYNANLQGAQAYGMSAPDIAGGMHALSPDVVKALYHASNLTGVPYEELAAQAAQESGGKPSAFVAGKGYGLLQWDVSTPSNLANSAKYLGVNLTGNTFMDRQAVEQAALDPQRAAMATAAYDKALLKDPRSGGRWDHALAMYNAGGSGWGITGTPGEGRAYGQGVAERATEVKHALDIRITAEGQNGHPATVTHVTHTVDTSRKPVAHATHGPTHRNAPMPPHRRG